MSNDVRVTNFPKDGSTERVAYDLMFAVANAEQWKHEGKPRQYLLALYAECIKTVRSGTYNMDRLT